MSLVIDLFGNEIAEKRVKKESKTIEVKKADVKKLVKRSVININDIDIESDDKDYLKKLLKSNKLTLADKVELVQRKISLVLGKFKKNVIVIRDKEALLDYVDKAIYSGHCRIAIDTETNNSLDPVTCKLMGLCLYYPGGKQAYIPVNHTDLNNNRLDWQLTEADIREVLIKINESGIDQIYANFKFDYEVFKCTCDVEMKCAWDVVLGRRLLNENEEAGLKPQYIKYCDPTQRRYSLGDLTENVLYQYLDPYIFALYAATDAFETDEVYLVQVKEFEAISKEDTPTNREGRGLYWVFKNIELPIAKITGDMELVGVDVDEEFGERLKQKYTKQLEIKDAEIAEEMKNYKKLIEDYLVSPEANERARQYQPKKSKKTLDEILEIYTFVDERAELVENGKKIRNPNYKKRYKLGKSKAEQLENPINFSSPPQLAIFFYDILKCNTNNGERGTGKEELERIAEENPDLKICKLLLERRGIVKLITTYIDVIPILAKHWPDGRIRFHLNSIGTDTGRYSSGGKIKYLENNEPVEVSGINIQNIPSKNTEIRMLFKAKCDKHTVEVSDNDNYYEIPETDEVETTDGWKFVSDLQIGDEIIGNNNKESIINIIKKDTNYLLYV